MGSIFIIKAGTTFPGLLPRFGDFDDWVRKGLGIGPADIVVINPVDGEELPRIDACQGVVVTGSHAMVTDELPWSVALTRWIPHLVRASVPFLGICYGHQLLASAMGGSVGNHPGGKEIGTVDIELLPEGRRDPLFRNLPECFPAHVTHTQTVLFLPPGATLLARNTFDPYHAFRVGNLAWGVQFHPEYDIEIMNAYIREQEEELLRANRDVPAIFASVRDTPKAAGLLKTFAALCRPVP